MGSGDCHGGGPDTDLAPDRAAPVLARPVVALAGNPNVGKSTLFNALTGSRQRVVNAPGTTVEVHVGRWTAAGVDIADLPGAYSLLARSADEEVLADCILGRSAGLDPGLVVVVLDATALARSLYLLGQVAEAGRSIVVALTFTDVARSRGEDVEPEALARELGVPVVPVDPRTGAGCADLAVAVAHGLRRPATVQGLGPAAPGRAGLDSAGLDSAGLDSARPDSADPDSARPDRTDPEWLVSRADDLFAWVAAVEAAARRPLSSGELGAPTRTTRSDRVDALLLHPWAGIPVFLLAMWALLQVSTRVALPLMNLVSSAVAGPVSAGAAAALGALGVGGGWLEGLLVDGVLAGVGTVVAFAPLMGLVFLAVAVLEDSGYLARAAVVADRGMRAIGLDGRALLPLVVGFGCNVPALTALRTVPGHRQRLLVGLLVPYASCSARLTVYILLASVFFPANAGTVIFAMYVASVALIVGVGLLARRTAFRDVRPEPLVLVLPPYQRPRLGPLLRSAWARVIAFLVSAGRVIVATATVVWVLMAVPVSGQHAVGDVPPQDSAFGTVSQAVAPVLAPAGFGDWHASAALITGFVAKEVVVASFVQTYGVEAPASAAQAQAAQAQSAQAQAQAAPASATQAPAQAASLADAGVAAPAPATPDEGLAGKLRATFDDTSGGHGQAAALAFLVFVLAYTPCVATLAEQRRLFGWRWSAGAAVFQLLVAWVAAVGVFQIGRLW